MLARLREASTITPAAVSAAREHAAHWRATLSSLWDRVDLLALPTLLGFPPPLDRSREMVRIRGLTSPVNLAGVPALALPVPTGGPLPASIQLIGPAGGEERLLAAGAVLEQAMLERPDRAAWPYRGRLRAGLNAGRRADRPADPADDRVARRADHRALGQRQVRQVQRAAGPAGQQRRGRGGQDPVRRPGDQRQRRGEQQEPGRRAGLRRCRAVPRGTG